MKESSIVKPCLSKGLEIFDMAGGLVRKKFQFDIAELGFNNRNLICQRRNCSSRQHRNTKQNNDLSHGTPEKMI